VTKPNPFENLDELRRQGAELLEFPTAKTTATRQPAKRKTFAIVPLGDDWGYRAFKIAGSGSGIVLYALHVHRMTGKGDVAITATVLKRCGLSRKARLNTINRLVKAGLATVRYRGSKHRGCPLLTLNHKT
jgi:hypothetical protein